MFKKIVQSLLRYFWPLKNAETQTESTEVVPCTQPDSEVFSTAPETEENAEKDENIVKNSSQDSWDNWCDSSVNTNVLIFDT